MISKKNEILLNQEERNIRKIKLNNIQKKGFNFPNNFKINNTIEILCKKYNHLNIQDLKKKDININIAGRIINKRVMGKASFITLQEKYYTIQVYVKEDNLPILFYKNEFKKWDIGDIIGVIGCLFKTKTNELSIRSTKLILLTKSIRSLPDKFHGLINKEIRYRQRYLDLICNKNQFKIFIQRSNIINCIREYMIKKNFLEVETPMLQNIPGGASAKPFSTYHNSLNNSMYLRISPELYLKKLIIGGFTRIFEINRSFRNEGISYRHNPEFTMMEIYQSYTTYKDMMILIEKIFKKITKKIFGSFEIKCGNNTIDFNKKFTILTIKESIVKFNSSIDLENLNNLKKIKKIAKLNKIKIKKKWEIERIQLEIFEKITEKKILQPTFIIEYPVSQSPLARRNELNKKLTDRFELFINGLEIANGFSELNDYQDQKKRFQKQIAQKKNKYTDIMYDKEYIKALEYGLPPTSGLGIGIDRIVMILTNSINIRDVILFPTLKNK